MQPAGGVCHAELTGDPRERRGARNERAPHRDEDGARGAIEVGFIERIAELGIPIDFVVGTSVGALNAAHVAFHMDSGHDCLRDIWRGLSGQKLVHRSLWRIARNLRHSRLSLYDHRFVADLVSKHLRGDDFRHAGIPLYVTSTNRRTGERAILSEGPLSRAILASTAIPGVFPPVEIDGDLHVDGGVSNGLDIDAAVELGATHIIAMDPRATLSTRNPGNVIEVVTRSLEILTEARSVCSTEHRAHAASVVHIRPGISLGSSWNFDGVEEILAASYRMACAIFDECWDGRALIAGHYHPETLTGPPASLAGTG